LPAFLAIFCNHPATEAFWVVMNDNLKGLS